MRRARIAYRNAKLEACERDDLWTVRLGRLEARARYLDLALAELLSDVPGAHRAAARLLVEMEELAEEQVAHHSQVTPRPRRERRSGPNRDVWAKPVRFGFRIVAFAVVASTTFMLTTWLSSFH